MAAVNPYVGPRPFGTEDRGRFFGRGGEVNQLVGLLYASRVLILFAGSGAGKTSLLQAGLVPALIEEGFEVFPAGRVSGLPGTHEVGNIYAFNAISSWVDDEPDPDGTLAEHLAAVPPVVGDDGAAAPRLLIFDQFEELFTAYPDRWRERGEFIAQVRDALDADPLLRVVFSMREEFVAQLDLYLKQLYGVSMDRFHLERLRAPAALAAVAGPITGGERRYGEGVAERLVADLMQVRVDRPGGSELVAGEYAEPVQLQVVCETLWEGLPAGVNVITAEHLRTFGDVDDALERFYDAAVANTVADTGVEEAVLRSWFEEQLITRADTRGTVYRGAEASAGIPETAVKSLEDQHVIRGETQRGAAWIELAHDRFIGPIRTSNRRFRERRAARRRRLVVAGLGALLLAAVVAAAVLAFMSGRDAVVSAAATPVVPQVDPQTIDFGDVVVGFEQRAAVTLGNGGEVPLDCCTLSDPEGPFQIEDPSDCLGMALPPDGRETCMIEVVFTPGGIGEAVATPTLVFEAEMTSSLDAIEVDVALRGNGVAPLPDPVYSRPSLDFDSAVAPSEITIDEVILENPGERTMIIEEVGLVGDAGFTVIEGGCEDRFLVPGSQCVQRIGFVADVAGPASATLRIGWRDELGPAAVAELPVSGFGAPPPPVRVAVDFDEVATGESLRQGVDLVVEQQAIVIGDVLTEPPFTVGDECDGIQVGPGQSCTVTVTFSPVADGPVFAELLAAYRSTNAAEPEVEALVGGLVGTGVEPAAAIAGVSEIEVASGPNVEGFLDLVDIATGHGAVWVTDFDQGRLFRIDPESGDSTAVQLDPAATPRAQGRVDGVAIGLDAVWVVGWTGMLYRVDPDSLDVRATQFAPDAARTSKVAYGVGALWVVDELADVVYRVDPARGEATARIATNARPIGLAVGADAVWVSNADAGTVTRIDPATGQADTVEVGSTPVGIGIGEGFVWVANRGESTVSLIDQSTFVPGDPEATDIGTIVVGLGPDGVAVGEDSVWITNRDASSVSRIDIRTFDVDVVAVGAVPGGSQPDGVAVGFDSVWTANSAGNTVTRISLEPGS